MFARLSTGQMKSEKLDELIRIYKESIIPAAKSQNGICGAYLLANRETGKVIAIAFWDKEDDAVRQSPNFSWAKGVAPSQPRPAVGAGQPQPSL
jgi:hypothetical protein